MRIAIFASLHRPHALEIVRRTVAWLHERNQSVQMADPLARAVGCVECGIPEEAVTAGADFAISIGGDGTMLGAVRTAAPAGVPVLGVNAGALGFLTEITPEELPVSLPRLLDGEYALESRMMLEASLYRGSEPMGVMCALNDVVIRQGAKGRLITLHLLLAGHELGSMGADGVIISTPTGSTAYGLAAGGPIVHPILSVLVLVPICAHSLSFRPMVVPATDPVEVLCAGNPHHDEMMLTADGQEPIPVLTGDRVVVRPAPNPARLVKFGLSSFYDRLREKLQWGGR